MIFFFFFLVFADGNKGARLGRKPAFRNIIDLCHCVQFEIFFLILFEGERDRQRQRQRNLPSTDSLPKCPWQPWLGLVKARSEELNLGLTSGWQGPKHLSRLLLFSTMCVSRKLDQKQSCWNSNHALHYGIRCPNQRHKCCTKCLPQKGFPLILSFCATLNCRPLF